MREPVPQTRSLKIFEVLGEAWELTYGSKGVMWAPILAIIILAFCSLVAFEFWKEYLPTGIWLLLFILVAFVCLGIFAGILKFTIERARGAAVSASMCFSHFSRVFPLILTMVCVLIIFEIPYLIYLIQAYLTSTPVTNPPALFKITGAILSILLGSLLCLSNLFAIDKFNSPFRNIYHSIKATWPYWFRIIAILLIGYVVVTLLYIPMILGVHLHNKVLQIFGNIFLLVGMVWVLPWLLLTQGVLYHKLVD